MRVAILSGKGGTGKTMVSVNLAAAVGQALYVDCDVEEPNGALFFCPGDLCAEDVTVAQPAFDGSRCTACRKCVDVCRFGALAFIKERPFLFEEVCHACGACMELCPAGAVTGRQRAIGRIEQGTSGKVRFLGGRMNPGESTGVPIIRRLLELADCFEGDVILDCPPGSACMVMESLQGADYCVLVAEPTVFGAHNLAMVADLAEHFHKPCGVLLNKCTEDEDPSFRYCVEAGLPVLARIPFDRRLGTLCSQAQIACREDAEYAGLFSGLAETIRKEAEK